ncbi:monoamine oxidase [Tenacibaculum skagerrakense]|uniref:Monoamine oxidase n=1 Tax=Tenacibaculum skagerrakense TaxID=186571 RepID=A0A4R2NTA9_9FLAO|nr:FAD-dependent oxidoreductase [Tenacibaculum skagerrakense]TCP24688.1 monoamine oxidase [Tenacibaculum skagerrakense]
MNKHIVIIGGGLSGLIIAHSLKEQGYSSIKVVEASSRLGGRIYTKKIGRADIELGATWLWKYNTQLISICKELEIELFEQKMEGDALFEAISMNPVQRFQLPPNQEISYRIANGTNKLINKLSNKLGEEIIHLNKKVIEIKYDNTFLIKTSQNMFKGDVVITTIPPKLLVNSVQFIPELAQNLQEIAKKTHTWMQDSIKFSVVFKSPFWRKQGLSGVAFSNVGPYTELYDHCCVTDSGYALMGFITNSLSSLNKEQREQAILQQLTKFFGDVSSEFISYEEKVWKKESLLTVNDGSFIIPHQNNGHPLFHKSLYDGKLIISGSETSPEYGGYMEGAVRSAYYAIEKIKNI